MIHQLYDSDKLALLRKPETGMGYQIVEAKMYNDSIRKFVVYNSEIAVDIDSTFLEQKTKLFSNKVVRFKRNLKDEYVHMRFLDKLLIRTDTIRVLEKDSAPVLKMFSAYDRTKNNRHTGSSGAIDSKREFANGTEIFVRLSAFEDDKRIDFTEMKLKSGSYTTTTPDYLVCVATKDDPVDRYALPNDEEIKWSFYIKPKSTDTLQRGIVQPAFEHAGGGIECYFENGTSQGTYLDKREYGK